jgi:hypothetical protein
LIGLIVGKSGDGGSGEGKETDVFDGQQEEMDTVEAEQDKAQRVFEQQQHYFANATSAYASSPISMSIMYLTLTARVQQDNYRNIYGDDRWVWFSLRRSDDRGCQLTFMTVHIPWSIPPLASVNAPT